MELLEAYADRVAEAARRELDSGRDAIEASRAIATLNDALTQRLLARAEADLGPPPCPYAWLALGSQGRREQSLLTDQDNALAYATQAPAGAGDYFAALAERVVAELHEAGLAYCPGGYMATNWCRPLADWQATFRTWLDRPSSQGVVEAEVFLDFRRVHGSLDVGPLDALLRTSSDRPRFLLLMARAAVIFRPPLRFGRIRGREVDLKKGGLAATVLLARLYALAGGLPAHHTIDRLQAAAGTGRLSAEGAAQLIEAYHLLTDLRLRTQLRAHAQGLPPTNVVPMDQLSADERSELNHAFHVVRDLQQVTELHFHTELIS
jgi:CBS domain-containing protein